MVRRDLEADGGFAEFFRRPGDADLAASGAGRAPLEDTVRRAAALTAARGLTDGMGQLNHARGGRFHVNLADEHGDGRSARPEDVGRAEPRFAAAGAAEAGAVEVAGAAEAVVGSELIDGMGQLNKRMPLVGKAPPWRQPPTPPEPTAARPFAW